MFWPRTHHQGGWGSPWTDGRRIRLDGALVILAVEDEWGWLIALSERRTGEGHAIRSLAQGALKLMAPVKEYRG